MPDLSLEEYDDFLSIWNCDINCVPEHLDDLDFFSDVVDTDTNANLEHFYNDIVEGDKHVSFLQGIASEAIDLVANMEKIEQSQWSSLAPEPSKSEMQFHPGNEVVDVCKLDMSTSTSFKADSFSRNNTRDDNNAVGALQPFTLSHKDNLMVKHNCINFDESAMSELLYHSDLIEESEITGLDRRMNQIKEVNHLPLKKCNAITQPACSDNFQANNQSFNQAAFNSTVPNICATVNTSKNQAKSEVKSKDANERLAVNCKVLREQNVFQSSEFSQVSLNPLKTSQSTTITPNCLAVLEASSGKDIVNTLNCNASSQKAQNNDNRIATASFNMLDEESQPKLQLFDHSMFYQGKALPLRTEPLKGESEGDNIHISVHSCQSFSKDDTLFCGPLAKDVSDDYGQIMCHNEKQLLTREHLIKPQRGFRDSCETCIVRKPLKSLDLELAKEEIESSSYPQYGQLNEVSSKTQIFKETKLKRRIQSSKEKLYLDEVWNRITTNTDKKSVDCDKKLDGECLLGNNSCMLSQQPTLYIVSKKDRLIPVTSKQLGQLMVKDLLSLSGNSTVRTGQEKLEEFRRDFMLVNYYKQKRLQPKKKIFDSAN